MSLLSSVVASGVDERVRKQASSSSTPGPADGVRADFRKKYSYFPAIGKPVIAATNGPVVGLGLVIALYCDLRFASDAAKFSTAFARRGLIAEYGLAWILPRLVGHANALDLLFSAAWSIRPRPCAWVWSIRFSRRMYSRKGKRVRARCSCEFQPALNAHHETAGL